MTEERTSTKKNLQQARGKLSLEVSKCQEIELSLKNQQIEYEAVYTSLARVGEKHKKLEVENSTLRGELEATQHDANLQTTRSH